MSELTPPRKPEPHECCGTGCIPCVMDIYEEELYEYEKAVKALANAGATQVICETSGPLVHNSISSLDPV